MSLIDPNDPWPRENEIQLRGGLRGKVSQHGDGRLTVLTPRGGAQSVRNTLNYVQPSEIAPVPDPTPSVPTPTPTITPTPTPTFTPTPTPSLATPTPLTQPPTPTIPPTVPPSTPTLTIPFLLSPLLAGKMIPIKASKEVEKYKGIYSNRDQYKNYGHSNHGSKTSVIWDQWNPRSILDVGCGWNEFIKTVRKERPWMFATGVDFACPGADSLAVAYDLPFREKQFDVLTAFDMLEHLRPEEVEKTLKEFERVSHRFVFSISYNPSINKWKGKTLHPTVMPEEWWKDQITKAGGINIRKFGRSLYGEWSGAPPVSKPVPDGRSVVVVGNGPCLIGSGLGPKIDSYDEVLRFNTFKTKGYEEDVGTKTTLWSTFGKGTKFLEEKYPKRIIYIHGMNGGPIYPSPEIWRLSMDWFNAKREEVRQASVLEDKSRIIPTSGYLVSSWLLDNGVPEITLAGFDHFSKEKSGAHHYWSQKSFGKPKEHDGEAEARLFSALVSSGRVQYL